MKLFNVLRDASARDISFRMASGILRFSAPPGGMTSDIHSRLISIKPELLAWIATPKLVFALSRLTIEANSLREGYIYDIDEHRIRIKSPAIIDQCRFFAPALGLSPSIPPPIWQYPPICLEQFQYVISNLDRAAIPKRCEELTQQFRESAFGCGLNFRAEVAACTALAGELASKAGLVPWPPLFAMVAMYDYEEVLAHDRKVRSIEAQNFRRPNEISNN